MNKVSIIPRDVISNENLPGISVDSVPTQGDPVEVDGELYFVCEQTPEQKDNIPVIGVIPLVVRNPQKVKDINKYIDCLSIAHRKVRFRNSKGYCDLENCDEMVISE
jgi:hypothetical protein